MESNSISRLSQDYNNRLINKINDSFSDEHQQLFLSSFYCYLKYDPEADFVIDLDNIWKWLGFSQKIHAKTSLEKHFNDDVDYKIQLRSTEQTQEGRGGHNKQTILLNVRTFKLFCLIAGTEKAKEIHKYFVKMEQLLHQTIIEETNELRQQLETMRLENEQQKEQLQMMKVSSKVPTIYIFNTNVKEPSNPPMLKIGITNNLNERVRPYLTINPHGKMVFHEKVENPSINIKDLERTVHCSLSPFRDGNETFKVDVDMAVTCIKHHLHGYNLCANKNVTERNYLMKKLQDSNTRIFEQGNQPVNMCDASTQTEFDHLDPITTPIIQGNPEFIEKFNAFINDHCIVHQEAEVSAKDIVGQYRLHIQEAKKEITQAFTDYLKRRFVYDRLHLFNNKDQVIYGYRGVKLKPIEYKRSETPSDAETFVFENCIFTPGGTVLTKDIIEQYRDWKKTVHKITPTDKEERQLKQYLKDSPYTLSETVWTTTGNGTGFYGIKLKRDVKYHRHSTTGCQVYKKDVNGCILNEYITIAKAAESEQMCPAKMSRAIRDKRLFGTAPDTYYYEKTKE